MRSRLAAVLIIALTAAATGQAQEKATLICRMGGDMVWSYIAHFDVAQMTLNGKQVRIPVVSASFAQLNFAKAQKPVSESGVGLAPGVCGWTDRPMRSSEPSRVIQRADSFFMQYTVRWGNGSTLGSSVNLTGGQLAQQNKAVFKMTVARDGDVQFRVVEGTAVKLVAAK